MQLNYERQVTGYEKTISSLGIRHSSFVITILFYLASSSLIHIVTFMLYLFLFIIGLLFGSFGSVLSSRLGSFSLMDMRQWKKEFGAAIKWILRGRSQCPHCHHTLGGIDLIPIISYCSTGWKCRYCKKSISIIYPILEIWCGLLFLGIGYLTLPLDISNTHIVFRLLSSRLLYLLIIFDIETMYLHEPLWLVLVLMTAWLLFTSPNASIYYSLQRCAISTLFFVGLYYFARFYVRIKYKQNQEWFGMWDVRLAPIIGIQLGLIETRYTDPSFLDSFVHFWRYIIIAWVLGLLYAGIHKLLHPSKSVRSIPFFPGMIVWLWIIMWIVGM